MGSCERVPHHVFSNGVEYELFCVTELGEYLMIHPDILHSSNRKGLLFPGESQTKRFSKAFTALTKTFESEIRGMGYLPGDLGSHSIRKGAGGSTSAPSPIAVRIRGAWKLGSVQDSYLLYESSGNQYVGHTLSGLNVMSSDFVHAPSEFICLRTDSQTETFFFDKLSL